MIESEAEEKRRKEIFESIKKDTGITGEEKLKTEKQKEKEKRKKEEIRLKENIKLEKQKEKEQKKKPDLPDWVVERKNYIQKNKWEFVVMDFQSKVKKYLDKAGFKKYKMSWSEKDYFKTIELLKGEAEIIEKGFPNSKLVEWLENYRHKWTTPEPYTHDVKEISLNDFKKEQDRKEQEAKLNAKPT